MTRRHGWAGEWYRCPACGNPWRVTRTGGQRRASGHVKTMWCPRCRRMRGYVKCG